MSFIDFIKKYQQYLKVGLLLIVLALIWRFIASIDYDTLKSYIFQMPLTFVSVIVVSFLAYLCATIAWQLCLGKESRKTALHEIFMIRHVGEMLSIFNPTSIVAGESLKAIYLSKKGIEKKHSVSSIFLSRFLIILSAIFLIIISSLYLMIGLVGDTQGLMYVVVAGIVLVAFGYFLSKLLLHKRLYFGLFVERLKRITGWSIFNDKLVASSYEVNQIASDYYRNNKLKFVLAFILSVIHWIFGAAEFYLVLHALDIDISIINAIALEMGVIIFKTLGAVVPGQIGVEEYGNKVMLDVIGVTSNEIWLVVSLMRRARQLFWLGVAGIFALIIPRLTQIKVTK